MIKLTLVELFFLSLPLVIFLGYRKFLVVHKKMEGADFSPVPYHKLFVAGGVVALAAFFILALSNKKITDQKYVPAYMEDGKLIPGGFERREQTTKKDVP
ncbi:hypothetical protein MNBD_ALPHA06-362 [hydrothermal vent metagenome]|uniref:Uncharacterized protein n=1 Tax=hydrothermal vent metagenome TaxID=652676 RepID=A0A3B0RHD6_9ZZZZ